MSEPLFIELSRLAEGPVTRSEQFSADAHPWMDAGLEFSGPPRIEFTARSTTAGGVQVDGRVEATIRLSCRRCLVEQAVSFSVPLSFIMEPGVEPGAEDDGVFPLHAAGDAVSLAPIVREELLLAVPEFHLCRADCRGLCPQCGTDLNVAACECRTTETDPRWEALRKLRA